ncbi:MAG: helix-turn-helix domain-containing protein [Oscillospiraceae bacterium]|nr:helix-turn-helix domain-containing protein [Oscillospiraceae bacterium]
MSDKVQTSFSDVLKVDGVFAKGYGLIPKIAMQDTELSLTAKTIYALFCSFAGNGNTTFPGRDYIRKTLDLSKDTYYKYLKQLTDQGYITIKKNFQENGQYANNIYTLENNPKKITLEQQQEQSGSLLYGTLSYTGIRSAGYGLIPRMVMLDDRLSTKAKGLYAYLASYSGAGKVAFPSVSKIQYHLQISTSSYHRFLRELRKLNYLMVVQRHIDGKLGVNDYFLTENPDVDSARELTAKKSVSFTDAYRKRTEEKDQCSQIWDMDNQHGQIWDTDNQPSQIWDMDQTPVTQEFHQRSQIWDTVNQDMVKQDTVVQDTVKSYTVKQDTAVQDMAVQDMANQDMANQDTEKQDTISNSFSSNSSLYYQSINQQVPSHWIDSMDRNMLREYIQETLEFDSFKDTGIPHTFSQVNGLIELVLDVLQTQTATIRINGGEIPRLDAIKRFLDLTYEHYEYVLECVQSQSGKIRNIRAYYLTALYNAPSTMDAWYEQRVNYDLRNS